MPSHRKKSRKPKSRTISLLLVLVFLFAGVAWGEEEKVMEDKSVPQDQVQAGEDLGAVRQEILTALKKVNAGGTKGRSSGVAAHGSSVVKVEPGRNVTLTVAGDQLNRIVTPFINPLVHTVSAAKINVDGSVVYVSLARDGGPATIFITENGESDPSISLTLMPQEVPPREVRLQLAGSGSVFSISGGKSAKWEKSQPYTEAIEKVMLGTARGEVPPGYNLRNPVGHNDPRPRCRLPVRVEPRQVMEGHNLIVVVSKLTNISSQQLMMDESACYEEGVRAVAVWPQVSLAPRQSSELYVVYQREMGQKPSRRPNVLHQRPGPAETICEPEPSRKNKTQPRPEPEGVAVSELLQSPRPLSANLP